MSQPNPDLEYLDFCRRIRLYLTYFQCLFLSLALFIKSPILLAMKPNDSKSTTPASPQLPRRGGSRIVSTKPRPTLKEKPENWTRQDAIEIYGIDSWGAGYFGVNEEGHVVIHPHGTKGATVDLYEIVGDLRERGIRTPILIRLMDIIDERLKLLNNCFKKAIEEYEYEGSYQGVYPIKVNQQKHLVKRILKSGAEFKTGLECGSKPELLVALAMMKYSEGLLICNGFKDSEYVETALLSQLLGYETVIVVEKPEDLDLILKVSERLNIQPNIGVRARLESPVSGKWKETSGSKSKFGLNSVEIVRCVEKLEKVEKLECLKLLHFHIGSQIPSIQSIKGSIKEGARFYTELMEMGASIQYLDVGGGLGIDYDGTGGTDSSINYSEQEYANDVVSIIQNLCDEKSIKHPTIVSESGRALTAHHSLLVFDVLGFSAHKDIGEVEKPKKGEHIVIAELYDIHEKLTKENLTESFNDVLQYRTDVSQLFSYGILSLKQRASAETLIRSIFIKMEPLAKEEEEEEILEFIQEILVSTYYTNFSVFQSLPDSWAVGQVFPVMPIHRLTEKPDQNGVIVDLTCDSDGRVDQFVQNGEATRSLTLHRPLSGQPYFLGIFLVGAYQEILGDLHNLFGDTDAVSITIDESGYQLEEVEEGDTVSEILSYIQYSRGELISRLREATETAIRNNTMSKTDARLFMRNYEDGLAGYTYLEDQ